MIGLTALQDSHEGFPVSRVPSAKQLLTQLPPFGLRDRAAATQVLTGVLDRCVFLYMNTGTARMIAVPFSFNLRAFIRHTSVQS